MIIFAEEVVIHHVNTNVGHSIIVRYDKLNFVKHIDMKNVHESQHQVLKELDELAFNEFRCGRFTFEKQERHDKAVSIIQLKDEELIDRIYSKHPFEKDIIKRELKARGLYDRDIYYMGFYGIDIAKQYAIDMLKEKIVCSQEGKLAENVEKNLPRFGNKKSLKVCITTLLTKVSDLKMFITRILRRKKQKNF